MFDEASNQSKGAKEKKRNASDQREREQSKSNEMMGCTSSCRSE